MQDIMALPSVREALESRDEQIRRLKALLAAEAQRTERALAWARRLEEELQQCQRSPGGEE